MYKPLRQLAFVFVFGVYGFIFYCICYYSLAYSAPEYLEIPMHLSPEYIAGVLGIFTVIAILAYIGASYMVLGDLPPSSSPKAKKISKPKHSPASPVKPAKKQANKSQKTSLPPRKMPGQN